MLQMPTGTGKTFLFASIIKDIVKAYRIKKKEINILVVAHRTELIDQISATLNRFNISHGFVQGSREQYLWRRVQVASILSLLTEKNFLSTIRQRFDYIIIDEAHHSLTETYKKLFSLFPEARKLGVTATPWRFNNESFCSLYDYLIQSPQISWFIHNGILADFEYISIKPDSYIQKCIDSTEVSSAGDFVNESLDKAINNQKIRSKLYDSYVKYAKGRKGIIYAINKLHACRIAKLYCSHGVKAEAIDCDTPKEVRARLIESFKEGRIQVLVNVEIFTEGFDCPDVNFIQLARPTRSLALFLQQVGRGLRLSPNKDKTIIIDNVGLYNYFGLPDADRRWELYFDGMGEATASLNIKHDSSAKLSEHWFDEDKLEEDDEPMVIVRSLTREGKNVLKDAGKSSHIVKNKHSLIYIHKDEFTILNDFLVRGNDNQISIYPLVKNKGKQGKRKVSIGTPIYHKLQQISWGPDKVENKLRVEKDKELHRILIEIALKAGLPEEELFNLDALAKRANCNPTKPATLKDVLRLISKLFES